MFWTRINSRWTEEELNKWSSLSKIVYLLFPIVIYYLVGDITEFILWWILNIVAGNISETGLEFLTRNNDTLQGMIYGIGLIFSVLILRKAALAEIKHEDAGKLKAKEYGILVLVALISSIGLNYLLYFTGLTKASETYNSVSDAQYGVAFVVGLFLYGIMSPVVEEVIFRGILYNRMKRIFPVKLSMVVSALLFGLFHGNIVQGIYGFLMGLIIVFFYEKYKSFQAPVILHIVANIGVYVLTYTIWR